MVEVNIMKNIIKITSTNKIFFTTIDVKLKIIKNSKEKNQEIWKEVMKEIEKL